MIGQVYAGKTFVIINGGMGFMRFKYSPWIIASYVVTTATFLYIQITRLLFLHLLTPYHEVCFAVLIGGMQFLHYGIYRKAHKESVLNDRLAYNLYSIDKWIYAGRILFILAVTIGDRDGRSVYFLISSVAAIVLLLGMRKYALEKWT